MKTFFHHTSSAIHILTWILIACTVSAHTSLPIDQLPGETKNDRSKAVTKISDEDRSKSLKGLGDSIIANRNFILRIEIENDEPLEIEQWMVNEHFWTGNK